MRYTLNYEDFLLLEGQQKPTGFVKTLVDAVRKRRSSEATKKLVKSHQNWITSPQGQRILLTMGILGIVNGMLARERLQIQREKQTANIDDNE